MSIVPVELRNIDVDDGVLPCAAAKLVVTQYFDYADSAHWAWIIVGTFLDHDNRPLWSTEIFLARLEQDSDSESQFGDSDFDAGESTTELYDGSRRRDFGLAEERIEEHQDQERRDWIPDGYYSASYPPSSSSFEPFSPNNAASYFHHSPETWDLVAYGSIPGQWQARFDPHTGHWIHTRQPQF
ncbi:hypothetical protein E4U40_003477 [Claviceps sp. LM458 group G5]|nr:hypothetical protein E4U40_003477 [Claviceps sp. LM458 group G5]